MRILPQHLGLNWQVRFIQARDDVSKTGAEPPKPRLGLLGNFWASGTGLDERSAAAVVPTASNTIFTTMAPLCGLATGLLAVCGAALFASRTLPVELLPFYLMLGPFGAASVAAQITRSSFQSLVGKPLAAEEVDRLLEKTQDPMDRRFLELVRDAVRQPGTPDSEENVRTALGALAEAIERLPPIECAPLDTEALRAEAAHLQHQAGHTSDRVVAESMDRRARALLHRVEAHEHSTVMVQRSRALRSEIEAQIDALREGLVAQQTQSLDAPGFAFLADSARQVATEAVNMASAREELDAATGTWPVAPAAAEAAEPAILQARSQ
jgi:hypothetical protein